MTMELTRRWPCVRCVKFAALAALLLPGCNKPPSDASDHVHEQAVSAESRERAVAATARMLEQYRKAESYTDHATYIEESVLRGEGVAHELPYYEISLALTRPNLIRLEFSEAVENAAGQRHGFTIACDGELMRAVTPELPDQMVENPAPEKLAADNVLADPLIREKLLGRALGDVFPQLAMLLNDTDADDAAVFPQDFNPRMLENKKIGDRDCLRVATSHSEGTRVLWIDAETYALRRMELPIEAHRQRIDPDNNFLRLSVRIDFNDATIDAQIQPRSFTLEPEAGVRRVRRFVLPEEGTAKDAMDAKVGEGEAGDETLDASTDERESE
jgi:outer membrane lipoprotein-sorting protein